MVLVQHAILIDGEEGKGSRVPASGAVLWLACGRVYGAVPRYWLGLWRCRRNDSISEDLIDMLTESMKTWATACAARRGSLRRNV